MENMSEFNSDQRQFFRINDSVFIELNLLDENEVNDLSILIKNHANDATSKERSQLQTLQTAFAHVTDQINQQDREIARALRLLDEKITILTQSIQRKQNNSDTRNLINVNLSGGGIAFFTDEKYAVNSTLEVRIELRSSAAVIHAIADVTGCDEPSEAPKETPYHLRLTFSQMSDYDRNILIKHTLSRQAENLRTAKNY